MKPSTINTEIDTIFVKYYDSTGKLLLNEPKDIAIDYAKQCIAHIKSEDARNEIIEGLTWKFDKFASRKIDTTSTGQ